MRDIKFRGWDGSKYDIGSDGSIWSNDFNNSGKRKELKKYYDKKDGYKVVYLTIGGVRKIHAVRKLVAHVFLGERPKGLVINHKNGIRDDDRAENLEYVTQRENTLHGWRVNGRKHSEKHMARVRTQFSGANNPKAKLTAGQVDGIRDMRKRGFLLKEIASNYQMSIPQIWAICAKKFWV